MEEEDEPSVEYFDEGIQMMKESLQLDPGKANYSKGDRSHC